MSRTTRIAPLLFILVGLAAACGPDDGTLELETRHQPIERVCGADRYTGPQGVDVSYYQGSFDWAARKREGIKFGFARISDGTNYIDDTFPRNWREMKDKGILRGAYQYFRPAQSATAQANMMVQKVGRLGPGDLPAVIDVESAGGQSPSTIRQKIQTWVDIVEEGTGKKPIIYTAAYFWRDNVGTDAFNDHPLWVANYGATCPLLPPAWSKWTVWQYCDGNPDYCSNGRGFDRNVFNGTVEDLRAFANGSAYGAEYVEQSFPLASTTLELVAGETTSGYFVMRNIGSEPWTSATHFATTEPRDRNSVFADESWVAPNRPARVEGTVAPGETYRFEFNLRAPQEPGEYSEFFGLVQEGVTWFSAADHLGPPDDQLQVRITVLPAPEQPTDPGANNATDPDPEPGTNNATMEPTEPEVPTDPIDEGEAQLDSDGLPPLLGTSPGLEGGCSQADGNPAGSGAFLLLATFCIAATRRRRARG